MTALPGVIWLGEVDLAGKSLLALTRVYAVTHDESNRRQEVDGLAIAMARESAKFSGIHIAKGGSLRLEGKFAKLTPNDLLRYIELHLQTVFDINASRIYLLVLIDRTTVRRLVREVVGYCQGFSDLRFAIPDAKLRNKPLSSNELRKVADRINRRSRFTQFFQMTYSTLQVLNTHEVGP